MFYSYSFKTFVTELKIQISFHWIPQLWKNLVGQGIWLFPEVGIPFTTPSISQSRLVRHTETRHLIVVNPCKPHQAGPEVGHLYINTRGCPAALTCLVTEGKVEPCPVNTKLGQCRLIGNWPLDPNRVFH